MKKIILPLLTAALLLPTLTAHATYRAEKRQDARDIRQVRARVDVKKNVNA